LILAQLSCSYVCAQITRVSRSRPRLPEAARGLFSLAADPDWAADPVQASAPVSCPGASGVRHYPDSAAVADSGDQAAESPAAGAVEEADLDGAADSDAQPAAWDAAAADAA
jgi:hypothetical protein